METLVFWTSELDKDNPVDVVYLDFCKAFDKVPHERLLTKMKSYNITNKIINWTRNFLYNRKQRVIVNGKKSQWLKVTSGIPQGSVIGPLFYF